MAPFVSSKTHQGDDIFSVRSRSKQCSKYTTDRWSKTTFIYYIENNALRFTTSSLIDQTYFLRAF